MYNVTSDFSFQPIKIETTLNILKIIELGYDEIKTYIKNRKLYVLSDLQKKSINMTKPLVSENIKRIFNYKISNHDYKIFQSLSKY